METTQAEEIVTKEQPQIEEIDLITPNTSQENNAEVVKSPEKLPADENEVQQNTKSEVAKVKDLQDQQPSTSSSFQPPIRKKRKKGKKIKRSQDYPKFYRNAYVRYCDEVRVKVCEENPNLDSVEITKLVASKWYALANEIKQPYLDEAKIDKERFKRELKEYKTQNPDDADDKPSSKKKRAKLNKSNETESVSTTAGPSASSSAVTVNDVPTQQLNISTNLPSFSVNNNNNNNINTNNVKKEDDIIPRAFIASNCEVPIFTDAFLEHNKMIEAELKILRKNNIEIEQQNSVLMKHIENMENGVRKVEAEVAETKKKNMQLEVYLTKLRVKLSANFHSLSQPNWKSGATVENINKYIQDLAAESQKSPSTGSKAREIMKKIDLKMT